MYLPIGFLHLNIIFYGKLNPSQPLLCGYVIHVYMKLERKLLSSRFEDWKIEKCTDILLFMMNLTITFQFHNW